MITLGSDWNSLIWLVVLFFVVLPALKGRRSFGPGKERWQERMGEWKERGEQRREEERAFRDQLISELRRHNAVAEQQNALMAEAIERITAATANSSKPDNFPEI